MASRIINPLLPYKKLVELNKQRVRLSSVTALEEKFMNLLPITVSQLSYMKVIAVEGAGWTSAQGIGAFNASDVARPRRFYSTSSGSDNPKTPVENDENRRPEYRAIEMILRELQFKYGPNPNVGVILRDLAVCNNRNVVLQNKLTTAENNFKYTEEALLRAHVFLLARNKIEITESMFMVNELKDPSSINLKDSIPKKVDKHYRNWKLIIVANKDDPALQRMQEALKRENIDEDVFCKRIAALETSISVPVHLPYVAIRNYSFEKIIETLDEMSLVDIETIKSLRVLHAMSGL